MKPVCSILIPTFNNSQYLIPCINSIYQTNALNGLCELVIINNGKQPIDEYVKGWPNTRVLSPGKNLGWEGGLQYGIENTDSEYLCFQNDDTIIPFATQNFYDQLLWPFSNRNVAAVGPSTTVASGWHSIFMPSPLRQLSEVTYLIFFTVMVRRQELMDAGGIDTSAPGGDDFDLSIRFRKMGKNLLINPSAFIIHHAFKTGERVRGTADKPGGWNSKEMTERTNKWLIQKHGFKTFMETMRGMQYVGAESPDIEGDLVASLVRGEKVLELGCGGRKTVPQAIGIDQALKGTSGTHLSSPCVADIQADVSKPLPIEDGTIDTIIARHILEHMIRPIDVLKNWSKALKVGGRIIIAVPDQGKRNTIPLNPEHVCAYYEENLRDLMEISGWKTIKIQDAGNSISIVGVFEKVVQGVEVKTNGISKEKVIV